MFRSNPLGYAAGVLFLSGTALAWFWSHRFPYSSKLLASQIYFVLASGIGFWMWQHGQRRARIVEDIPTSKVISAPQGYVELLGRAQALPDQDLISGPAEVPCLWYRCQIARRGETSLSSRDLVSSLFASVVYFPEDHQECDNSFQINDGSGSAIIFPHGAEVITEHKQTWYEGDTRYIEERIMPGDTLYVLGDFSSHHAGQTHFDLLNEVSAQVSIWQADKQNFLRRFDRNGNGVIDADEWEAMHAQALRLAKEKEAEQLAAPTVHRVMKPDRGFHYLISSRVPAALAGHYRFWRGAGLTLFLGAGAAAVWLFSLGLRP